MGRRKIVLYIMWGKCFGSIVHGVWSIAIKLFRDRSSAITLLFVWQLATRPTQYILAMLWLNDKHDFFSDPEAISIYLPV